MKSSFQIDRPDDMSATLTITLKVGEWRGLRDRLNSGLALKYHWLVEDLAKSINEILADADKVFYARRDGHE